MTNQINNQRIIPSTDVIQLTLTLKMITAQVVETSVTVNINSPIQDYVQLKPFTHHVLFKEQDGSVLSGLKTRSEFFERLENL